MKLPARAKTGTMTDSKLKTDIDRIGKTMSRYRVLAKSRIITRLVIGRAAPDLDIGYIDIVESIGRITRKGGEVTIGTVAEQMCIDPSRASRAVAHLVERDIVSRGVSQLDARRAVIFLTEKGQTFLREKIKTKLGLIEQLLADWPEEDIAKFSELYSCFLDDFERVAAEEAAKPENKQAP